MLGQPPVNNTMNQDPEGLQKERAASFMDRYYLQLPKAIHSLSSNRPAIELGFEFEPSEFDVVCGRGKGSYNRPGNKNFRSVVTSFIPEYERSRTKIDKTATLNIILDRLKSIVDPSSRQPVKFVKLSKAKGWIEISDDQAREKIGHAMREARASQRPRSVLSADSTVKNNGAEAQSPEEFYSQDSESEWFYRELLALLEDEAQNGQGHSTAQANL